MAVMMAVRVASDLGGFLDAVRGQIAEAGVAAVRRDRAGVAGSLHWVHRARTDRYSLITCHHDAAGRASTTPGGCRFHGVAVHDARAPCDAYTNIQHQLCCAHAVRELAAVAETTPAGVWCCATQAADALVAM